MKRAIFFTLIELLVVIVIITILASMLLPSISKTRERARQIECTSRLKQCGMLFSSYSVDFDDYMLPNYNRASLVGSNAWDRILDTAAYVSNSKILFCPTWNPAPKYVSSQGYGLKGYSSFLTQAQALRMAPANTGSSWFILLVDSVNHLGTQSNYLSSAGYNNSNYRIHLRHLQNANCLFLDGHVDLAGLPELKTRSYYPYPLHGKLGETTFDF